MTIIRMCHFLHLLDVHNFSFILIGNHNFSFVGTDTSGIERIVSVKRLSLCLAEFARFNAILDCLSFTITGQVRLKFFHVG